MLRWIVVFSAITISAGLVKPEPKTCKKPALTCEIFKIPCLDITICLSVFYGKPDDAVNDYPIILEPQVPTGSHVGSSSKKTVERNEYVRPKRWRHTSKGYSYKPICRNCSRKYLWNLT